MIVSVPDSLLASHRSARFRRAKGEAATIDRAVSRLIARVERDGGMPPERVKAEETPAGDVVAACEALSFGGLRLVLVEGADAWKAADAAPVVRYLEAPNEGSCLAMVSAGPLTPARGADEL